jgi:hypothetical protein
MKCMSWNLCYTKWVLSHRCQVGDCTDVCVYCLLTWHFLYLTKLKLCEYKDGRFLLRFRLHPKPRSSSAVVIVIIYYQRQQTGWLSAIRNGTPPLPKRTRARKAKWVMNLLLSGLWHCRLLCNACTLLPEYVASHPRRQKPYSLLYEPRISLNKSYLQALAVTFIMPYM